MPFLIFPKLDSMPFLICPKYIYFYNRNLRLVLIKDGHVLLCCCVAGFQCVDSICHANGDPMPIYSGYWADGQPKLTSVGSTLCNGSYSILVDTAAPGAIGHATPRSVSECIQLCDNTPECTGFDYDNSKAAFARKRCWIHNDATIPTRNQSQVDHYTKGAPQCTSPPRKLLVFYFLLLFPKNIGGPHHHNACPTNHGLLVPMSDHVFPVLTPPNIPDIHCS